MSKIFPAAALTVLCLFPGVLGQPNRTSGNDQKHGYSPAASPTPVDKQLSAFDQAVEDARKREEEERARKEDTYKEAQFQQNGVIATAAVYGLVITGANVLVALAYVFVAFFTLRAIRQQADKAGEQIQKMDDTLREMKTQRSYLAIQTRAALSQGQYARQTLLAAKKQAADELWAIQGQWQAMVETLQEQRKLVAQNERAITASENSAKAARQAVEMAEASEAPYFGIIGVRVDDFIAGYYPGIAITFFNGGKTPAWHFFPTARFVVGEHPKYGTSYPLEVVTPEISATFFAAQGSHNFEFKQTKLTLTERIVEEKDGLFLIVTAEYLGRSKTLLKQSFTCVWERGKFCDWIADAIDWGVSENDES
jgi:hypothetical protein